MQRILIIEDDPSGAQLLSILLQLDGFETMQLEDWVDSLSEIAHYRPDLIVMDVRLQGRSGFDLLDQLRAHPDPEVASTLVLMISAEDHRIRCKQAGANGFLLKPFDHQQLFNAIEKVKEDSLLHN